MIRILAFLAALFVSSAAWAQSAVIPYCGTGNAAPNDFGACSAAHPLPVSVAGQFPTGATAITGNGTGTTGAVVGTLAGVAGKTTYICGFNVSATGGTGRQHDPRCRYSICSQLDLECAGWSVKCCFYCSL